MNTVFNAAASEFELLTMEIQDLVDIIEDQNLPDHPRACADLRLAMLQSNCNMAVSIMHAQVLKMDIDEVLAEIDNNLSNQCN
jgi:hypothetical protein